MMAHHHHHDAVQATDEPSTLLHLRAGSTADHECLTDEGVLPQGEPTMKPLPQGGGVARLARGPTASSLASGLLASMHAFDDSGPHSSPAPISATALVLRV